MSLTIDLSPAEAQKIQSFAEQAGLPVADYAHRLLAEALQQQSRAGRRTETARRARQERRSQIAEAFAATGITEAELERHAQQAVDDARAAQHAREHRPHSHPR